MIPLKKACIAAGLLGATLVTASAQAALVTQWNYSVSSTWSVGDTVFSSGGGTTTETPTLLSWGATGGDHTDNTQDTDHSRSGLEITNSPAVGVVNTNGGFVPTNTVTHYNNALSSAFATLLSAKMTANVKLSPVVPGIDPDPDITYAFDIHFAETPNSAGDCVTGSVSVCDDIFVIAFGSLNKQFTYDGLDYFISIVESTNKLKSLPADACAAAGAGPGCIGFMTQESAFTPSMFAFAVTTERVGTTPLPEPGMLILLSAGLLGAGLARRRNHS